MGGFSASNGQSDSSNGANITGGGNVQAPSGTDLQNQVGGLFNLGNVTEGFQNFMSPITDTVRGIQDDGNKFLTSMFETNSGKNLFDKVQSNIFGIEEEEIAPDQGQVATEIIDQQVADRTPDPVVEPTPTTPELSPYEKRIQELMTVRGFTREEAVANQAHAQKLNTDGNSDGAVTNKEWALSQGADFDGDGDVTHDEWRKHKAGGQTEAPQKGRAKKRKGMTAEEMRLAREAALARFQKVSL